MNLKANTRGTIVIGSTASDAHVVPIFLISVELERLGFRIENLRGFNSAAAFAEAVRRVDARALVISNNNGQAFDDLAGLPEALDGSPVPVLLGGHFHVGVGDQTEAREKLKSRGVTQFVTSIEGLVSSLEALA